MCSRRDRSGYHSHDDHARDDSLTASASRGYTDDDHHDWRLLSGPWLQRQPDFAIFKNAKDDWLAVVPGGFRNLDLGLDLLAYDWRDRL